MPLDAIRTDVLIVGAGPTGQTLACALARAGAKFHLIEKLEQRSPYSRALIVHLRSLEILNQLDLSKELLEEGNSIRGARLYVRRKRRVELDLSALFDRQFTGCRFRGALLVEQDRTEAALDRCLSRLGSRPHFHHELLAFEEGEDGVSARCRDEGNREYSVECRYLVGCDGAHSLVRSRKQIPFSGSAYAQDFMLADVDLEWDQPRRFFYAFLDRRGFMALGPLREKTRLIAAMGRYREDSSEPTLDDFKRLVARLVPHNVEISNPGWITRFRLHHRIADRFRAGRVLLVGDAAHIHSPAGGQGMNTGIQDAWNLGWKLAWALRDPDRADPLLDTYHEERYPVGQRLIQTTDRLFNFISGQSLLPQFVRTCMVPWLGPLLARLSPLQRRGMYRLTQLGIHYRGSSLAGPDPDSRHFTRALVGGDRMPDISLNGDSLHRLLDATKPTLLTAGTEERVESPRWKALHLSDPTDDDRRVLGMKRHGMFLIRPDGHLAARAVTQQGLIDSKLMRFSPD